VQAFNLGVPILAKELANRSAQKVNGQAVAGISFSKTNLYEKESDSMGKVVKRWVLHSRKPFLK